MKSSVCKGGTDMFDNCRSFFSRKKADEFIEFLEIQGVAWIQLTIATDAFGQKNYRVEWREED